MKPATPLSEQHPPRHRASLLVAFALATVLIQNPSSHAAAPPSPSQSTFTNAFFVFDNGLNDEAHRTVEAKADLLKELGYDGVGWRPGQIPEMRQALDTRGLSMFTIYTGARIGPDESKYDPNLPALIGLLRGSGAVIWLTLTSNHDPTSSPQGDDRAVALLTELSDLAAQAGLKVALYPHHGMWLETVEDAVRLARKVNRPNLGVTFNLCHCLRAGNETRIPEILRAAKPHLFLVSINGADSAGQDWGSLIQTLDRGTFDQHTFLQQLQAIGYTGPIGLQCYNIPGDVRDNLTRSMNAWRALQRQLHTPATAD